MFKFNFNVCDENISSTGKVDTDADSSSKKSRKGKNNTIIMFANLLEFFS